MMIKKMKFIGISYSRKNIFLKKYFSEVTTFLFLAILGLSKILKLSDDVLIFCVIIPITILFLIAYIYLKFNSKVIVTINDSYFLVEIDNVILDSRVEKIEYGYGKNKDMVDESIYICLNKKKYFIPNLFFIKNKRADIRKLIASLEGQQGG